MAKQDTYIEDENEMGLPELNQDELNMMLCDSFGEVVCDDGTVEEVIWLNDSIAYVLKKV